MCAIGQNHNQDRKGNHPLINMIQRADSLRVISGTGQSPQRPVGLFSPKPKIGLSHLDRIIAVANQAGDFTVRAEFEGYLFRQLAVIPNSPELIRPGLFEFGQ